MRDDLMPVEVKIDPMLGASALGAAEKLAVKGARCGQVVDGERQVKRGQCHRLAIVIARGPKQ